MGDKLVKTGSIYEYGFGTKFNYEAIAEYLVYKICKYLNIPDKFITPYKLCNIQVTDGVNYINTVGCECSLFVSPDEAYLSFYKYLRTKGLSFTEMQGINSYKQIIEIYKRVLNSSEQIERFLNTMFLIDSLVLNSDRHLGNFGFIINKNGGIDREAPIFDNGNSLFCNKPFEDMQYDPYLNIYISQRPIARDFDYVLKIIDIRNSYIDIAKLGSLVTYVKTLCTRLVNSGNLPQSRADFIVAAIKSRVEKTKG